MIGEWLARARLPLADRVQEIVGRPVLAAVRFTITSADEPVRVVLVVTDLNVYLLDGWPGLLGLRGGVVGVFPRERLVVRWRRGRLRVAASLSWPDKPDGPAYVVGWARPCPEADELFGLLTAGEFEDVRRSEA